MNDLLEALSGKNSQTVTSIEEGYNYKYVFTSISLFILGIFFFIFIHFYFSIPFILAGSFLLFSKSTTIVETKNRRIGKAISVYSWVMDTKWFDLKDVQSSYLDFEFIQQRMSSRGSSTNFKTKSYKLLFELNSGKRVEYETYTNYKIAKKVTATLENQLKISCFDKYLETQKKALQKRKPRRR